MSLASPWDIPQDQTRENVREYKRIDWILCPCAGETSWPFVKIKDWGSSQVCKTRGECHRDLPLSNTIHGTFYKNPPPFSSHRISTEQSHNPEKMKWLLSCTAKVMRWGDVFSGMNIFVKLKYCAGYTCMCCVQCNPQNNKPLLRNLIIPNMCYFHCLLLHPINFLAKTK